MTTGRYVVLAVTEPGSPSRAALHLLARATAPSVCPALRGDR
ncbi:hypothetical protein [Streptomyces sp. NPDC014734]